MANQTWNFPCDWRVNPGDDGSEARISGEIQPFSSAITVIFAFLIRSKIDGKGTDTAGNPQTLIALGDQSTHAETSGQSHNYWIEVRHRAPDVGSGTSDLHVFAADRTGLITTRYDAIFGDEDGASWLQEDKWYQVAISSREAGTSVVINGDTSPTSTVTTNVPGALNLQVADRMRFNAIATKSNVWGPATFFGAGGRRSCITGPVLIDDNYLDITDAAVRARIFDSNGDFKNPGKNGSLWLGDEYGERVPLIYMPDGWVRRDFGRAEYTYDEAGSNTDGEYGGLRKDHE